MAFTYSKPTDKEFELLPEADYEIEIEEASFASTQSGREYLKLKIRVAEGDYKNRVLFDEIYRNRDTGELSPKRLCHILSHAEKDLADGTVFADETEIARFLTGQRFVIHAYIESQEGFKDRNRIRYYKKTNRQRATLGASHQAPSASPFAEDDLPF